MKEQAEPKLWVAIRVWRGFPVEAKAFRRRPSAERQELAWRKSMNPDYDETAVLPLGGRQRRAQSGKGD